MSGNSPGHSPQTRASIGRTADAISTARPIYFSKPSDDGEENELAHPPAHSVIDIDSASRKIQPADSHTQRSDTEPIDDDSDPAPRQQKRKTILARSADEKRLLPDFGDDKGAVPIPTPKSSRATWTSNSSLKGGFKPRNTLGIDPFAKSIAPQRKQGGSVQTNGRKRTLDTKPVVGDNVRPAFDLHGNDYDRSSGRCKRPKTDSVQSPDRAIRKVEKLDASNLGSKIPTGRRHSTQPGPYSVSSAPSQTSTSRDGVQRTPKSDEVKEYQKVEGRMRIFSRRNRASLSTGELVDLAAPVSVSSPSPTGRPKSSSGPQNAVIDLDLPEEHSDEAYLGRATSKAPQARNGLSKSSIQLGTRRSRDAGQRGSKFFSVSKDEEMGQPRVESRGATQETTSHLGQSRSPRHTQETTPQLSTSRSPGHTHPAPKRQDAQSRLRRSSDDFESPDPLQIACALDVEEERRTVSSLLSTHRQARSRPPATSPTSPDDFFSQMQDSAKDIRPTKFTRSGRNETAKLKPNLNRRIAGRSNGSNRYPLRSLNSSYADVYKADGQELHIEIGDAMMHFSTPLQELQVWIKDIHKILHDSNGEKVRLTMRRGVPIDDRFDLEFRGEKVARDFLRKLQEHDQTVNISGMTSEQMSKIFEKRRREQAALQRRQLPADEGGRDEEVAFIQRKRELEKTKRSNRDYEAHAAPKRPRNERPRALDRLSNSTNHNDHAHPGRPTSSRLSGDLEIPKTADVPETRSKTRLSRSSDTRLGTEAIPSESPAVERYSKKHGLGRPWEAALVFPLQGERKSQTTVDQNDLERLDEGEFLNDNLISFYLRYLEYQMEQSRPLLAKRIYIFNTFFYERLTNTARGKRGINYEAVQKWTSKVDIFNFDFVVVPINESAHWYVAVICNLPNLARSLDSREDGQELTEEESASTPENPGYKLEDAKRDDLNEAALSDKENALGMDTDIKLTEEGVSRMSLSQENIGKQTAEQLATSLLEFAGPEEDHGKKHPTRNESDKSSTEWPSENESPLIKSSRISLKAANPSSSSQPSLDLGRMVQSSDIDSPTSKKKGKRQSGPPPRKYNPQEPIIITLDSLGFGHPPTVRNLKLYLQEEGKVKRGLDIDIGNISGMTATAKQIPRQDNYCDCGLFLLGYMEKFMRNPRDLATRLLTRQIDADSDWPEMNPQAMRVALRELLLKLAQEQEQAKREAKGKHRAKSAKKSSAVPDQPVKAAPKEPQNAIKATVKQAALEKTAKNEAAAEVAPVKASPGKRVAKDGSRHMDAKNATTDPPDGEQDSLVIVGSATVHEYETSPQMQHSPARRRSRQERPLTPESSSSRQLCNNESPLASMEQSSSGPHDGQAINTSKSPVRY